MTLRELLEDHDVSVEEVLDQQIGGIPEVGKPWIKAEIGETGAEITIITGSTPYGRGEEA